MVRRELDFVIDHDLLLFYTALHIQNIYCVTNYLLGTFVIELRTNRFYQQHITKKDM